ncbi:MAG: hypothetical protein IJX08_03780 [Clostridia bacterium]|nr:hypothetical protein [Clostridia bacterium]MBQ8399068.1 hypothetical protein [Clostridia bacterium]
MTVYIKKEQMPERCRECRFLDDEDRCILLDAEENDGTETFEALHQLCPLRDVKERERSAVLAFKERVVKYYKNLKGSTQSEMVAFNVEEFWKEVANKNKEV